MNTFEEVYCGNVNDLISVIVPVYNVESYLERCVDSILKQTYRQLEIILIDDGSTDNSGLICDSYALKDKRIKVIHKENGGLSDARNAGIDYCKGKYVTFVDSDDFLDKTYVAFLYYLIQQGDYQISICNPKYYFDEDLITSWSGKEIIKEMDNIEALKIMLYQQYYDTSAWGKLYEKQLFSSVRFPKGKLFEDLGTIYKIMLISKNVIFSNRELYYYQQRNTSISGEKYNERKKDYLEFAEQIFNDVNEEYPVLKLAAASRCVSVASHLSMQTTDLGLEEENKFYYSKICQYRKGLLSDSGVRIKNKIIVFISYFGYTVFSSVLKIIKSKNRRMIKNS